MAVCSIARPNNTVQDLLALEYLEGSDLVSLAEALNADASSVVTILKINDFTQSHHANCNNDQTGGKGLDRLFVLCVE